MKNRLIRTADQNFTYVAASKPKIVYNNSEDPNSYNAGFDADLACDLAAALRDEMAELGPRGLAEYLDGDLEPIVTSIIVSVDGYLVKTTVKTTRKLTDEELYHIEDYVTGQFSDGFGEGFEQRAFAEIPGVYEYEDEDEESNITMEQCETVDQFFCSLYTPELELDFKLV